MNEGFWRKKRVFLTGHTGFKGAWLSLWLQELGAELTGYALPPQGGPSLFGQADIGLGMTSVIGDIRDLAALKSAMRAARPEVVIHMAAQPLVRQSYVDPIETYSTNVMGVVNLLEAVRGSESVKSVVNVTTDKCYENREWHWGYRESDPMGGFDPYSSSKGCAELVTAAYRSSFFNIDQYERHGVAIATARAGNVIGGGDWSKDRLVPDILEAFADDREVLIRNPNAIRPWQHVLEPLRGYLLLAEHLCLSGPKFSQAWNFGPNDNDARPVSWIADRLSTLWGSKAPWKLDERPQPHEATYLKLDISKAKAQLDWQPILALDQALELIVEWRKAISSAVGAREQTLSQIRAYQNLVARTMRETD